MPRSNILPIRLNDQELRKLKAESVRSGVSMSEVVRDWIKPLPDPEDKQ